MTPKIRASEIHFRDGQVVVAPVTVEGLPPEFASAGLVRICYPKGSFVTPVDLITHIKEERSSS